MKRSVDDLLARIDAIATEAMLCSHARSCDSARKSPWICTARIPDISRRNPSIIGTSSRLQAGRS